MVNGKFKRLGSGELEERADLIIVDGVIVKNRYGGCGPINKVGPPDYVNLLFILFIFALIIFVFFCYSPWAHAGDLSEHFSRQEFNQKKDPLPLDEVKVDPSLVAHLEFLRRLIGDRPIIIRSGYRSPEYNRRVGGAHHSQHMRGLAADIVVLGMTSRELKAYALKAGFTFVQTYTHLDHLHVDVREVSYARKK